jgi:hypothetical protein
LVDSDKSLFTHIVTTHVDNFFQFFMSPRGLFFIYDQFVQSASVGKDAWLSGRVFGALAVVSDEINGPQSLCVDALCKGLGSFYGVSDQLSSALQCPVENANLFDRLWTVFAQSRYTYRHFPRDQERRLFYLENFFVFYALIRLLSASTISEFHAEVFYDAFRRWADSVILRQGCGYSWDITAIVFGVGRLVQGAASNEFVIMYPILFGELCAGLGRCHSGARSLLVGINNTCFCEAVFNALRDMGCTKKQHKDDCFTSLMNFTIDIDDMEFHEKAAFLSAQRALQAAEGNCLAGTIARL